MGNISVTTSPVEGKIYIDGKYVGVGSYSGEYVIGTYTVSFGDVEGYKTPDGQTVVVKAGETIEIKGDYKKKFKGKIHVTTEPVKGSIYINGKRVGRGEFEGEYYEGTKLSVSFGYVDGYYTPENQEVTIEANKTTSIIGEYKPKPKGEIYIKTTSDRGDVEGDIYVDGTYVGVGSCTVERTIGMYTVSYEDVKGYKKPSSKQVEVEEGRTIKVVGRYEYVPPPPEPPKAEIMSPKDGATVYSDEFIDLRGRGDDPDGAITEYLWGVDGLVIGHDKDLRYKFKDMGKHTVTLAVIDNDGLSDEDSVEIYVDVKPVIHLSIAPDKLHHPSEEVQLTIAIKSLLPKPSTIVEIQEISRSKGVMIKEEDERAILTSFEVMSGKPEVKTISVNAREAGEYSIKLKGYYCLADDPSNSKQIESNEVSFKVAGGAVPTPEPPGFESVFAIIGLLTVAYLIIRRNK
jgi:hypothetical protein